MSNSYDTKAGDSSSILTLAEMKDQPKVHNSLHLREGLTASIDDLGPISDDWAVMF